MPDQIDIIVEDLATYSEEQLAGLALDLTANLIQNTPVRYGYARAGWVPSIGAPAIITQPERIEPAMVGPAQGRQQEGIASVIGYKLEQGALYVTNNVKYIGALNAGHSPQAPPGFVPRVIELTVRFSEHAGGAGGVTPRSTFVYRPGQ